VLEDTTILLSQGRIERIGAGRIPTGVDSVDAQGLWLLPGFVDTHSDALETAIEPRPGGRFPTSVALRELDRSLAGCGITTMFHSLSFYDTLENKLRTSDVCAGLIRTINSTSPELYVNTRVHLRFEITETHAIPLIRRLIDEKQVHLFSLMDHTPGQGQFVNVDNFRNYYGKVRGKSPGELDRLIEHRLNLRQDVDEDAIQQLAAHCRHHGITVASHDDDSEEKVRWNRSLGVSMAEFPVSFEAACLAAESGMAVSMGAPNILRGGSATGNLSGREAVAAGCGSIICSDYAPTAMLHAGMALLSAGIVDLAGMSRLLSTAPARAVGIDGWTGAIQEGKAADLVLVDPSPAFPRIVETYVAGCPVYTASRNAPQRCA
jgi:alpha-D-ribose 1-methylphosphonate 5-triphosphate diphosphatase